MIPSYRNVEPTPYQLVPVEYDSYYKQVEVPTAEMIAQQERKKFQKQVSRDTQDEFGVNKFDDDEFNNYQLYEQSPQEGNVNQKQTNSGQYVNYVDNTNRGVQDDIPQFYGPQMTMSQIPTEKPQPPPSFENLNRKSQEFQDFLYRYYIWNEFQSKK